MRRRRWKGADAGLPARAERRRTSRPDAPAGIRRRDRRQSGQSELQVPAVPGHGAVRQLGAAGLLPPLLRGLLRRLPEGEDPRQARVRGGPLLPDARMRRGGHSGAGPGRHCSDAPLGPFPRGPRAVLAASEQRRRYAPPVPDCRVHQLLGVAWRRLRPLPRVWEILLRDVLGRAPWHDVRGLCSGGPPRSRRGARATRARRPH
mmetsp:Transcript_118420/g.334766  ORF Transcript_118420/g.334766 Transcript_118420/m.334766 type:complete len:204 (-) Transcript_118420:420-1031(-)